MGNSILSVVRSALPGAPVVAVTAMGCDWSECDTPQQLLESPGPEGIFIPWHLPAQQLSGEARWVRHKPLAEVAVRIATTRSNAMIPCLRPLDHMD